MQVVVTGGSRGIGRAVVEGMAARGHRVLFTYNSSSKSAVQAVCDAYPDGLVTAANLDQGTAVAWCVWCTPVLQSMVVGKCICRCIY